MELCFCHYLSFSTHTDTHTHIQRQGCASRDDRCVNAAVRKDLQQGAALAQTLTDLQGKFDYGQNTDGSAKLNFVLFFFIAIYGASWELPSVLREAELNRGLFPKPTLLPNPVLFLIECVYVCVCT